MDILPFYAAPEHPDDTRDSVSGQDVCRAKEIVEFAQKDLGWSRQKIVDLSGTKSISQIRAWRTGKGLGRYSNILKLYRAIEAEIKGESDCLLKVSDQALLDEVRRCMTKNQ